VLEVMEREKGPIGERQAVERPFQQVEVGGAVVVWARPGRQLFAVVGQGPTAISRTIRRRRPRIAVRQVLTTIRPNQAEK
jgi:hypothetical protein